MYTGGLGGQIIANGSAASEEEKRGDIEPHDVQTWKANTYIRHQVAMRSYTSEGPDGEQ